MLKWLKPFIIGFLIGVGFTMLIMVLIIENGAANSRPLMTKFTLIYAIVGPLIVILVAFAERWIGRKDSHKSMVEKE